MAGQQSEDKTLDPAVRHEWDEIVLAVRADMEKNLRKQELYVERLLMRYSRCSQAQASSINEQEGAVRKALSTSPPGELAETMCTHGMSRQRSPPNRALSPLKEYAESTIEQVRQLRDRVKSPLSSWRSRAKKPAPLKLGKEAEEHEDKDDAAARRRARRPSSLALLSEKSGPLVGMSVNMSDRQQDRHTVAAQVTEILSKRAPVLGRLAGRVLPSCESFYNLREPPRAGRLAAFLRSSTFTLGIGAIILVNAAWTFYLADWSISHLRDPMAEWQRIVEVVFCVIWVLEVVMKLLVHRLYFFWNEDVRWNVLDAFLVVLTLLDQVALWAGDHAGPGVNLSFLRSLRILRLGRVVRLFRIFRICRELRNILNSIIGSLISLFWCLVMLTFILTLFALAFVILVTDHMAMGTDLPEEGDFRFHFGSVGRTMTSLYMATTGGEDWHVFYHLLGTAGWYNQMLFLMFISFFNLAVFNVLTGIFVDNAMKVSKMDEGKLILEQRRKEINEANALKRLCQRMDDDGSGTITWEEFEQHMTDPTVAAHFAAVGVEIHDAETFFGILKKAGGSTEVDIDVFVKGCIRMKGYATSIDMQTLAYELRCIRREQAKLALKLWAMASGEELDSIAPSSTVSCSMVPITPRTPHSPGKQLTSTPRRFSFGSTGHEGDFHL